MCCTPYSDAMVAVCLGIAYNNGGDTIVGDTTLVESLARKPRRCGEKVKERLLNNQNTLYDLSVAKL